MNIPRPNFIFSVIFKTELVVLQAQAPERKGSTQLDTNPDQIKKQIDRGIENPSSYWKWNIGKLML